MRGILKGIRTSRAAALTLPVAAVALALPAGASAATNVGIPQISNDKCEDPSYEDCRRLRFRYGPITVTPGNNAQLVGPVTIEKPAVDGYAVRVVSDIVRPDGSVPMVDVVHLHHGVWISVPQYGSYLPFYGVGEEKTASISPNGYGMLVRSTDAWLLNYMLHNLTTEEHTVFITYDVDFIPKASAERQGIKRIYPLWLDVRNDDHPFYPVFNVQKGYGHVNPQTGRRECTYPKERCAPTDPFGADQPGNGRGYDWTVPGRFAGTIVGLGGHLHPGGLRDDVSVVRTIDGKEVERPLFSSEAVYYDPNGPVSWDLSMTVTKPGYKVKVEPGDKLRLNATYDSEVASTYEDMGIVMAYVAPTDKSGVDPFKRERVKVRVKPKSKQGSRSKSKQGRRPARARPRYRWVWRYPAIDTRGVVTHGHLPENSNYGGEHPWALPQKRGPAVRRIGIAAFKYQFGDMSEIRSKGIPEVQSDKPLQFWNVDSAAGIWHTVTTCKSPCTGATGISYPLADALPALDSGELGWAPTDSQPTAQRPNWDLVPKQAGLKTGETYTYFCRVHPFMRGAFKVVD